MTSNSNMKPFWPDDLKGSFDFIGQKGEFEKRYYVAGIDPRGKPLSENEMNDIADLYRGVLSKKQRFKQLQEEIRNAKKLNNRYRGGK